MYVMLFLNLLTVVQIKSNRDNPRCAKAFSVMLFLGYVSRCALTRSEITVTEKASVHDYIAFEFLSPVQPPSVVHHFTLVSVV